MVTWYLVTNLTKLVLSSELNEAKKGGKDITSNDQISKKLAKPKIWIKKFKNY